MNLVWNTIPVTETQKEEFFKDHGWPGRGFGLIHIRVKSERPFSKYEQQKFAKLFRDEEARFLNRQNGFYRDGWPPLYVSIYGNTFDDELVGIVSIDIARTKESWESGVAEQLWEVGIQKCQGLVEELKVFFDSRADRISVQISVGADQKYIEMAKKYFIFSSRTR